MAQLPPSGAAAENWHRDSRRAPIHQCTDQCDSIEFDCFEVCHREAHVIHNLLEVLAISSDPFYARKRGETNWVLLLPTNSVPLLWEFPDIAFAPCSSISDAAPLQAGLLGERKAQIMARQTFICFTASLVYGNTCPGAARCCLSQVDSSSILHIGVNARILEFDVLASVNSDFDKFVHNACILRLLSPTLGGSSSLPNWDSTLSRDKLASVLGMLQDIACQQYRQKSQTLTKTMLTLLRQLLRVSGIRTSQDPTSDVKSAPFRAAVLLESLDAYFHTIPKRISQGSLGVHMQEAEELRQKIPLFGDPILQAGLPEELRSALTLENHAKFKEFYDSRKESLDLYTHNILPMFVIWSNACPVSGPPKAVKKWMASPSGGELLQSLLCTVRSRLPYLPAAISMAAVIAFNKILLSGMDTQIPVEYEQLLRGSMALLEGRHGQLTCLDCLGWSLVEVLKQESSNKMLSHSILLLEATLNSRTTPDVDDAIPVLVMFWRKKSDRYSYEESRRLLTTRLTQAVGAFSIPVQQVQATASFPSPVQT